MLPESGGRRLGTAGPGSSGGSQGSRRAAEFIEAAARPIQFGARKAIHPEDAAEEYQAALSLPCSVQDFDAHRVRAINYKDHLLEKLAVTLASTRLVLAKELVVCKAYATKDNWYGDQLSSLENRQLVVEEMCGGMERLMRLNKDI